ncbi:TPA: hypothetical protein PTV97_003426 [Clostridium botulinum]|nr:hypothetical protein [Clostridium botulinum]
MDFDDLKDLYGYAEKVHKEVACNDVPKVVKEVESDIIDEEVYSKYDNEDRRGKDGGGLGNVKNMETHINEVGNVIEIEVTNETPLDPPNDGLIRHYRLDEVVEYGGKYYEYPIKNRDEDVYTYLKPRPFTEKTEIRLLATKEHEKAYKNAMKAKGIDID